MTTKLTPAKQKQKQRIRRRWIDGKLTFSQYHNQLLAVYDKNQ